MQKKKSNWQGMSWVILAIIVVFIAGVYLTRKRTTPSATATEVQVPIGYQLMAFHPDQVLGFELKKDKNIVFEFSRKKVGEVWSQGQAATNQELLNALSSLIESEEARDVLAIKKDPKFNYRVTIDFANNDTWEGAWNKIEFYWISGPYAGKTAYHRDMINKLLAQGNLFEKPKKMSICSNRIERLSFRSSKNEEYKMFRKDLRWYKRGPGDTSDSEVDPNFPENWMGRFCEIQVDEYLDEQMIKLVEAKSLWNLEFSDKKQTSLKVFKVNNVIYYKMKDSTFASKDLNTAFEMAKNPKLLVR